MGGPMLRTAATGLGAIVETFAVPAGATYSVLSVTLALNVAPVTAENFTITLDANDGAAYDVLLYSADLAALAATDVLWQPDGSFYIGGGDALDVAWTNTDGRTWGLLITMLEV